MRPSRYVPLVAATLAFTVAGCGSSGGAADDGKISVVASTNVWGSVAAAVGGSHVTVKSLINNPSADPHSYADKPEDATLITGAKVVVYNGGGYDDFFAKLVDAAGADAKRINAFDLAGHKEGENEHVWYEFATVKKVADQVAKDLGAADPANRSSYTENAKAFGAEIDALTAKAAAIPDGKVVATEPVAKYLLDSAGMTDVTPPDFAEAIEEETDPPVAAVAATTDLVSGKKVVALINNDQTETNVTDRLTTAAKNAGVPIVNVSETLPQDVTGYVEWMTKQVEALSQV